MIVLAILFVGAALFWSGFEQAGSSLNIFASDLTQRQLGSFTAAGLLVPEPQPASSSSC